MGSDSWIARRKSGIDPQPTRAVGENVGKAIRPFHDRNPAVLEIIFKTDLRNFDRLIQSVEIEVKNGQPAAAIFVKQSKCRARDFVRAPQSQQQPFDEMRFPRAEVADERDNIVRSEGLGELTRAGDRFLHPIGSERNHGNRDLYCGMRAA